ncbi:MAG: hypothetical protein IKL65_04275 [Bacilli bacterium]|nr:hypothetical protein [Bacilli bacterium]
MKLNNKGFAISTIMYMILIMAVLLITITLTLLSSRKLVLDKTKQETLENIYSKLPSQYQEVEHIESTGTQYIDTGIIPNQYTGFDIIFLTKNSLISTPSGTISGYGSVMGARQASSNKEFQLTTYSATGGNYFGTLRYNNTSNNAGITPNVKMHVTLLNKVYTDNNGAKTTLSGTFTAPVTLTVFALNNNGTITQHGIVQLYSLKLYNESTMIRNFIPCYRKSDGEIGLYDTIENKFYSNEGTEKFMKGNDIKYNK